MLMDDFYTIIEKVESEYALTGVPDKQGMRFDFIIKLNPDHKIYDGHFPGNPVVPGVCQVQMITELASMVLDKELILSRSDNIKFLSMIRPGETPLLNVNLDIREKETGDWNVTGTITREEQVFLKFKGVMRTDIKQK